MACYREMLKVNLGAGIKDFMKELFVLEKNLYQKQYKYNKHSKILLINETVTIITIEMT